MNGNNIDIANYDTYKSQRINALNEILLNEGINE